MGCMVVCRTFRTAPEQEQGPTPIVPHCQFTVPTWTGKPGKMGRHFPVREKSGNFDQTGKAGKMTQNTGKFRKISEKYYLSFLVIFK